MFVASLPLHHIMLALLVVTFFGTTVCMAHNKLESRLMHLHLCHDIKQDKKLLQECLCDPERISLIAHDIICHFEKNKPSHAVVYVNSKSASVMYKNHLKNHPEINIVCSNHLRDFQHVAYTDTMLEDIPSNLNVKVVSYTQQKMPFFT